jgi:phage terminase large subunit GpA-like protein
MKTPAETLVDYAFDILKPDPKQTVVEWAESEAYLSERVTEQAGTFSTRGRPYIREILNNFADPSVRKISLCWGSQTAKTTSIYIGLGWVICRNPSPILWIWANEKQARNFSNDRFLPFCEDSKNIAKHLPKQLDGKVDRDRASALRIEFDNCVMNLIGGGSQKNVRQYPVSFLVLDEIDVIEKSIRLDALDRVKGRRDYKIIQSSTPIEESTGIWGEYLEGDQRIFKMPCPHCGKRIAFEWRKGPGEYNVRFDPDAKRDDGKFDLHQVKRSARYYCQECDGSIDDAEKIKMLDLGAWEPTSKTGTPGARSYHLNSMYSPMIGFGEMAVKWIQAQDTMEGLKQFVTGWLAEPWRMENLNVTEEATHALAGDYERGEIKGEIRLLSVDVQRAHFVWIVRGFNTETKESFLLDHGNCPTFSDLDDIFETYDCAAGVIDTGFGERTQECYEHVFRRRSRFWACKGARMRTAPFSIQSVDPFTGTGKAGKWKIMLLHVNAEMFGGEILRARAGKVPGFQLYKDPAADYVKQLNSKFIIETVARNGSKKTEWRTKRHGQDHFFDCEVYCLALARARGLGRPKEQTQENDERTGNKPTGNKHRIKKNQYREVW